MRWMLLFMLVLVSSVHAIEKPNYELMKRDGDYEVRKYGELHIVTATMKAEAERNKAFRKLAGYLGKKNVKKEKIKMTAPVIIGGVEKEVKKQKGEVTMSFVVPQKVVKAGVPKPMDSSLKVSVVAGGQFAVTSFKDSNSAKARAEATKKLRVWMKGAGLKAKGEPRYAFYNPPWIPQVFRTNEVWIEVGK